MRYNRGMSDTALIEHDLPNVPADIAADALAICTDIARGKTMTRACKAHGVDVFVFLRWREKYPEIAQVFSRCIEYWSHVQADELMTIPDKGWNPATARLHSENVKFLIARRNRKDYGDSTAPQDQVQGALVDALQQAIQRIPRPTHDLAITIDAQAIDITGE